MANESDVTLPKQKKKWSLVVGIIVVILIIGGMGSVMGGCSTASSKPTLESISATHAGLTTAGTTINDSTAGITVTGTYSDGSTKTLKGWKIGNPGALVAEQSHDFTITYEDKTCTLTVKCTSLTPQNYKASCLPVTYDALARTPEDYKGKLVAVRGKVFQIQGTIYLVNITQGSYGTWDDAVKVSATLAKSPTRVLENDVITIYGEAAGLTTYTTVLGASKTVPSINAAHIDVG